MILGDKATRAKAIPFVSNSLGGGTTYGFSFMSAPTLLPSGRTVAILMSRPEKGDVVEAYLFMQLTSPSNRPVEVRIGIGTFASGVVPDIVYSEEYLNQQHKLITGMDTSAKAASAGGTLFIEADLTRALHPRGHTEFCSDAFVLLVTFDNLPDFNLGYALEKFKLACTAQMGLAT